MWKCNNKDWKPHVHYRSCLLKEKPLIWGDVSVHTFCKRFVVSSRTTVRRGSCSANDEHRGECFPFFTGEWEKNTNAGPCLLLSFWNHLLIDRVWHLSSVQRLLSQHSLATKPVDGNGEIWSQELQSASKNHMASGELFNFSASIYLPPSVKWS